MLTSDVSEPSGNYAYQDRGDNTGTLKMSRVSNLGTVQFQNGIKKPRDFLGTSLQVICFIRELLRRIGLKPATADVNFFPQTTEEDVVHVHWQPCVKRRFLLIYANSRDTTTSDPIVASREFLSKSSGPTPPSTAPLGRHAPSPRSRAPVPCQARRGRRRSVPPLRPADSSPHPAASPLRLAHG